MRANRKAIIFIRDDVISRLESTRDANKDTEFVCANAKIFIRSIISATIIDKYVADFNKASFCSFEYDIMINKSLAINNF